MLRARVSRNRLTPPPDDDPTEPSVPAPASAKPARKVTSRSRALSADTLEGLGARRLSELLMDAAQGDPALARSLRLVLAGTDGGGRLAAEVEKRLRTIGRSRGFVEWDKVRPLARELDSLRETIAGPLAAADPEAAVAQMRLLLSLAKGVFERSDDGSGILGDMFRQAGAELGRLWTLLPARNPVALAGELLALLDSDGYGVTDRLLKAASPALGPDGRADLRRRLQERLAALPSSRSRGDFDGWHGRGLPSFLLGELADLEGDVDAFIAAAEAGGRAENLAGDIAERLIAHGRAAEALAWLDRAPARHEGEEFVLVDLRIAALDALGRKADAQALRWTAFERWLGADHRTATWRSASWLAGRTWRRRPGWCGTTATILMGGTTADSALLPRLWQSGIRPQRRCCTVCWPRTCCSARPPGNTSMPPAMSGRARVWHRSCRMRLGWKLTMRSWPGFGGSTRARAGSGPCSTLQCGELTFGIVPAGQAGLWHGQQARPSLFLPRLPLKTFPVKGLSSIDCYGLVVSFCPGKRTYPTYSRQRSDAVEKL